MAKQVSDSSVRLIEIGTSGKNFCLTLDKAALASVKEGKSYPINFQLNGHPVQIVVMRDSVFKEKAKLLHKLSSEAKQSVEIENQINAELGTLGESESKIILP